jgi:CRP/FNR family cyclic AMP-dependent transcriptional regulator
MRGMPANAAFLKDIQLFAPMDDQERTALAAIMDEVTFAPGQQLFHERDKGGICYVLRSGRVELSVLDENGEKLIVDVLEPGELCGELSLLDGGDRSTTAQALTTVEALVLERPEFLDFLRQKPDASLDVLAALAKRIRRADKLLKQRVQDPNEIIAGEATLGDRVADAVAAFGGSWRFIGMFAFFMAVWMLVNATRMKWDAYPYILLNLILSTLAALQAPVIMMSQNRQDAKDRVRSEADYRVNVRAMVDIAELHEKLDRMRGELNLQRAGRPAPDASRASSIVDSSG